MTTTQSDAAGLPTPAATPVAAKAGASALSISPRAANSTMVLVCAAVFLTALDQTVVVTALEPIAASIGNIDFGKDLSKLAWAVSGYLLGYVIILPLMGRISDVLGRQRVLIGTLALFAFGSLMCAEAITLGNAFPCVSFWSPSLFCNPLSNNPGPPSALTWLIIARFIQAVGGGAVVPVAIAAIGDLFGDRKRILALGIIGGVTEAGGALGPLYGALILAHWGWLPDAFAFSWQWIFLLNIPIVGLIVLALMLLWPKATRGRAAHASGRGIDWIGAALLGVALFCISLGLGQSAGIVTNLSQATREENNPTLLVAALMFLVGFILWEAWHKEPVIDLKLFRNGAFTAGAFFNLLLGMALIIALVDIPIYILDVQGATAYLAAGLALLRLTVMIPIGAIVGGWLVARIGTRNVGIAGAIGTAIGFGLMHFWDVTPNQIMITVATVITGFGFGLIVAPISTTALNTARQARFGMAASIVTALRTIGMILGLAALSSWGVSRYQQLIIQAQNGINFATSQGQMLLAQRLTAIPVQITHDFYTAGAALALLAIIPALFLWKPKPGEESVAESAIMGL
jgi:MFS family permease